MACEALFNTHCFLLGFLPLTVLGYWAVPSRRWKLAWIAGASLLFYSFWDVRFVALLLASAVVDFLVAKRIATAAPGRGRKAWLGVSIAFNLGVLGFFKYAIFALENIRSLFGLLGLGIELPYASIVLPVGISFYTFQTLSYTIDVYRGVVNPTNDFAKYVAYVTLFPQLVAGPIVRYSLMDKQLDEIPSRVNYSLLASGLSLFAMGLAKKVLVADLLAARVDALWADPAALTTLTAWLAALGYAMQLYFDFSGYSDMAIGLGAMLGLRFPVNFDAPYQARDPSDFWRRWHISLSTFLRDYLYIPLGGNRLGERRRMANLAIVMLLGGLWHGAAWTFVVWGAYHGLLLAGHRAVAPQWSRLPVVAQRGAMFLLVVLGWVVFRAPDLATATEIYATLFTWQAGSMAPLTNPWTWLLLVLVLFTWLAKPTSRLRPKPTLPWTVATAALLLAATIVANSIHSPFLYYQF